MRGKQVVHDDEMDFSSSWQFHSMQSIEAGKQRMRVILHVLMIILQDRPKVFVFSVVNGLDDETVVPREVEKGA